jgi:hypothetical protein
MPVPPFLVASYIRVPIKLGRGVLDKLRIKAQTRLSDVCAAGDSFRAGKRYWRKLNGHYRLDGTITLNGGTYIPV